MDPQGPYFRGAEPSLTDFILAPWAVRLWIFDHFKGGLGIPEDEDEKVWERWGRWVSAMEGRKSISETTSEREHYLPIYQRYADDEAQSELAKATRSGRGVP
jgi:glutathione S-transferase